MKNILRLGVTMCAIFLVLSFSSYTLKAETDNSKLKDGVYAVFDTSKGEIVVELFYKTLDDQIGIQKKIILQWKNRLKKSQVNIPNPLHFMFKYGEAQIKTLICIYYVCQIFSGNKKDNYSTAYEIVFILDKSYTHFATYKKRLEDQGYIKSVKNEKHSKGFSTNLIQITQTGIEKAKEMIYTKIRDFPEDYSCLISNWEKRYNEYHSSSQVH